MHVSYTFSKYISKQFLISLGIVVSALALITLLFDTVEMLRRTQDKDIPFGMLLQMIILKLPNILFEMLPFIILIASILTYSRLTRSSELIAARAAGVSVWQFLMPAVALSFLLGLLIIAIINPLAAVMHAKYETLEDKYFRGNLNTLSVSSTGLWLKQPGQDGEGKTIIHALKASQREAILYDVTIFMFNQHHRLFKRIYAPTAQLVSNHWELHNADITSITEGQNISIPTNNTYRVPTDMQLSEIQNSFADPKTISFWRMPDFIDTLKQAGLPANNHQLHWYKITVIPFFLSAMVFFAAAFSLHLPRKGKTGLLIAGGIMVGFAIRFLSDLVSVMGLAGTIPLVFSAWAPVIISLMLGAALMLHLEDG